MVHLVIDSPTRARDTADAIVKHTIYSKAIIVLVRILRPREEPVPDVPRLNLNISFSAASAPRVQGQANNG